MSNIDVVSLMLAFHRQDLIELPIGTDNAKAAALNMYTKFFPFLIDHSRAFNFKDLCMNTRPLLGNIEIDTSNNHSIIISGSMIFYSKEVELMCL